MPLLRLSCHDNLKMNLRFVEHFASIAQYSKPLHDAGDLRYIIELARALQSPIRACYLPPLSSRISTILQQPHT